MRENEASLKLADLTFVILTKNEAENLPRALASLPAGCQTLVIDAQSGDATVAIAREYGARVVVRAWEGFVMTRRFACDLVQTRWLFMLDADETLDEELRFALKAAPDDDVSGWYVRRTTYFCGRPMRAAGWSDERLLRCFRRDGASLVPQPVAGGAAALHERWEARGKTGELAGTLLHFSYPTLAAYQRKFARYTSVEAEGLRPSFARFIFESFRLVLRFGWLTVRHKAGADGWRGLYVTFWSAAYPVVVAWKAWRR